MPFSDSNTPDMGNSAVEWSAIEGGGLAQLIVATLNPFVFSFFMNGRQVPSEEVESLYVSVGEPDNPADQPESIALLSRISHDMATGQPTKQNQSLFPGTVEVVVGVLKRRITVTCPDADDPLDLYARLGLRSDGSTTLIEGGLKKIQIFMTSGILQINLAWEDGGTEDLVTAQSHPFSA